MSQRSRIYEAAVMQILYDAGAIVTEKCRDGASHQRVTFNFKGRSLRFHFATTANTSGHSIENCKAGLRRLLRSIPDPVVQVEPQQPLTTAPEPIQAIFMGPEPVRTKKTQKLTAKRWRELEKRYGGSHDDLASFAEGIGIELHKLQIKFRSMKGLAAEKLRREEARARTLARFTHHPEPVVPPVERPIVIDEDTCRRLKVYHRYGVKPKVLAQTFKLPYERVAAILHNNLRETRPVS